MAAVEGRAAAHDDWAGGDDHRDDRGGRGRIVLAGQEEGGAELRKFARSTATFVVIVYAPPGLDPRIYWEIPERRSSDPLARLLLSLERMSLRSTALVLALVVSCPFVAVAGPLAPADVFGAYGTSSVDYSNTTVDGSIGSGGTTKLTNTSVGSTLPSGALAVGSSGTLHVQNGTYYRAVEAAGTITTTNASINAAVRTGGTFQGTYGTVQGDVTAAGTITGTTTVQGQKRPAFPSLLPSTTPRRARRCSPHRADTPA